jgi:hypothetical protein
VELSADAGELACQRGTLDIDVYREMSLAGAEADLRHAAAVDIGDWFR